MILWIAFAVLAAAVIALIARPLLAEPEAASHAREADLAVYRDQLAEIEADRERGLISDTEAENARAELARRILRRSEELTGKPAARGGDAAPRYAVPPSTVAYASAVAIPLISLAIYLAVGSPGQPGLPHASRVAAAPDAANVNDLIAKVEAQLRKTPEDGRGWDAVAPVYLRVRRYDDAARAFAKAIRLQGETPRRLRGLGEALVMANDGIVIDAARGAYNRLLKLEPKSPDARFWLALADEQDGKIDAAREAYSGLLSEAPKDAPWRPVVEARLKSIDEGTSPASQGGEPGPAKTAENASLPGPTAEDIEAAGEMSVVDRSKFIDSMVARLAEKLEADPSDMEGWVRLVRAYGVLGRKKEASEALAKARANAGEDTGHLDRLDALAKEFGLET